MSNQHRAGHFFPPLNSFAFLFLIHKAPRSFSFPLPWSNINKDVGEWCTTAFDNSCGGNTDLLCCPTSFLEGSCQTCCTDLHCKARIEQPPAGEYGKPFCLKNGNGNNECRANLNGEESLIQDNEYPVYVPSETIDNSKKYRKYVLPRKVLSDDPNDPVFESLWYFDFNEQPDTFSVDNVSTNGTHITLKSYSKMHAGYSKYYKAFDEHETGIVTMYVGDNTYSVVADYPKVVFVEKYHALTFSGTKDEERGQYMKNLSAKQVKKKPNFDLDEWIFRAKTLALAILTRKSITAQVQAGVDLAIAWQIRRYVNSYTEDGSLTPDTSSRWASHSLKAQEAILLAKNPNFKREILKSEQHCKHLEEGQGFTVDYTEDTVTIPLGRPVTIYSGEMVNAPSHYLGFNVGHITAHYDVDENILQFFFQGFNSARQYSDVAFPGPDGFAGLYVGRVAEGRDYDVNPNKDGRGDTHYLTEAPPDDEFGPFHSDTPDVTLWRRPLRKRCPKKVEKEGFWKEIDIGVSDNSIYDTIEQNANMLFGIVRGIPCADIWMKADYGEGSHNYDANEIGVWGHSLGEIPDKWTKKMTLAKFWDEWSCFYQGKDEELCH